MKKVLLSLAALSLLSTAALASDAESLFKKCSACHGKDGGKKAPGTDIIINTLDEKTIADALHGYKAGTFGGKGKKTMELQVKKLSDEDINALAAYIVTLK